MSEIVLQVSEEKSVSKRGKKSPHTVCSGLLRKNYMSRYQHHVITVKNEENILAETEYTEYC